MRVFFTKKRSIAILIFLILGILFIVIPDIYLMPVIYWLMCVPLIIVGMFKLVFLNKEIQGNLEYQFDLYEGLVSIIVGVTALSFMEYPTVALFLGIIYLIIPLLRIVVSKNKKNQLLIDCLKYFVIFMLLTSNKHLSKVACIVIGVIFIAISVLITITLFKKTQKLDLEN